MAKDIKTRRAIKSAPCVICRNPATDPCHIKTYKVTQVDAEWNLIPMCRNHHEMQHRLGWLKFLRQFPVVRDELVRKGWEISPHPFQGGLLLSHPEWRRKHER